jgi:hypothetical protein
MKLPVLLLFFATLFFLACNHYNESKEKRQPYIISKEDSIAVQRWKSKGMPSPPVLIYGDYNFVVDSSGDVYLHKKSYPFGFYDTGIDVTNLASLHLDTSDLVPMSAMDIKDFLANAASHWDTNKYVVVASLGDTIYPGLIQPLIDSLKANRPITRWNIRKVTEEEATVLKNKTGRR